MPVLIPYQGEVEIEVDFVDKCVYLKDVTDESLVVIPAAYIGRVIDALQSAERDFNAPVSQNKKK